LHVYCFVLFFLVVARVNKSNDTIVRRRERVRFFSERERFFSSRFSLFFFRFFFLLGLVELTVATF